MAAVKTMLNTRIADRLDEEGDTLLKRIRADMKAKYDANGDGLIERQEAKGAWEKFVAAGGSDAVASQKDEL